MCILIILNILCIMDNIEHSICIINHLLSQTCIHKSPPHTGRVSFMNNNFWPHNVLKFFNIQWTYSYILYIGTMRCSIPECSELIIIKVIMNLISKIIIIKQFHKCNHFCVFVLRMCTRHLHLIYITEIVVNIVLPNPFMPTCNTNYVSCQRCFLQM
jgi:hypothetical protein